MNKPLLHQTGFTLLESIVAFSILIMVLGVAFQVFSSGAHVQRLSTEYNEASYVARSILNMAKLGFDEEKGTMQQRYHWVLTRSRIDTESAKRSETQYAYHTEKLAVDVRWESAGKQRHFQLDTIILVNNE